MQPTQRSFFVVVPAFAAFSFLLELAPARGREAGADHRGEAVAFSYLFQLSCLFQLSPVRRRESGAEHRRESCAEHRGESSGCSLSLSLFQPMPFLFHLTLSRVRPAPLSVEQVAVQRLNLVFGRSKSSQKRLAGGGS